MNQASMTPERWRRIEELYHAADALPPGERAAFLGTACPDDEPMRREVEALLLETAADGLLAQPALVLGARLLSSLAPAVLTGRVIGEYQLLDLIGAGGMGEVYRARHRKLGRDVAIKILPSAFTNDPDRLARFEREARMLAALNHPGICTLYGFEDVDGIRLLVLELVEGETLGEKLASRLRSGEHGLPLRDALANARQITDALEAAHDKGIVHRDLKPANIKITPEGGIKVLDFGLAKAVGGDGASSDLTLAPAVTGVGKREGLVVGTAAYMSPEQARGLAVDKRSDIWAFGCVVYEMLTGRVAFAGDTVSDSIAKILEREPDWALLPATTPASIRRLLLRSLAKDPKKRLKDISDARLEIDAIGEILPEETVRPHRSPTTGRVAAWRLSAAFVLGLGVAAVTAWTFRPAPALAVTRFTHTLPSGQTLNGSRGAHIVAVSPDGSQLVYSGTPYGLYLRSMADVDARAISGTEGIEVSEPVFSPDGRSIAFFTISDQTLKKIAVTGGVPQTLCPVSERPTGMSWSPGGILFGQGRSGIKRIAPDGGTAETLVQVKDGEAAHGPQLLPDGDHVLFTLATGAAPNRWDQARIFLESLTRHDRRLLIDGGGDARYLPTGHLVYAVNGSLYAVIFDVQKLAVVGERVPVVDGVRRASGSSTGAAAVAISSTGALVYVPGPSAGEAAAPLDLALMDRTGEVYPLHLPPGPYAFPHVSPLGTRVAFQSDDGNEAIIYTYELSGASTMQRLTSGGNNRFPIWVTEKRVAFQSDRDGDRAVWWQALDGPAERLTRPEPGTSHAPESWFGDTLLYSVTKGPDVSLWTLSLRDRTVARFAAAPSSAPTGAVFSPDGRWVAYATMQRSQVTLYVQRFPVGPRYPLTAQVSDTAKHPRWSRDGKELFYNPNVLGLESVRITSTDPLTFAKALTIPKRLEGSPPGSRTSYDITPDGKLVGLVTAGQKEFIRGSDNQIQVVLNWFRELEARVPHR